MCVRIREILGEKSDPANLNDELIVIQKRSVLHQSHTVDINTRHSNQHGENDAK